MAINTKQVQHANFDPMNFYTEYYTKRTTLYFNDVVKFYYDNYQNEKCQGTRLLDLCTGPTVHWLAAPSRKYTDITVSDLEESNLLEVKKWLHKEPGAFDWTAPFKMAAAAEGISDHNVIEERVRNSIKNLKVCDILEESHLLNIGKQFDAVQCTFGVDNASQDPNKSLNTIIKNISNVVKPGGLFLMICTLEAAYYEIGTQRLPKIYLTQRNLQDALSEAGFQNIEMQQVAHEEDFLHTLYQISRD